MLDIVRTDVINTEIVNGIDLAELDRTIEAASADPAYGQVKFRLKTEWTGQTRTESVVEAYELGGIRRPRRFKIIADEPDGLLGSNTGPNPQELLMAALNACMIVGYVANAAVRRIELECCEIVVEGELDVRGFLGIDEGVPAGCPRIDYHVRIKGNGTPEQFEEIHKSVMQRSPNYFNLSSPVQLNGSLEVL